jgi:hypothetical protein
MAKGDYRSLEELSGWEDASAAVTHGDKVYVVSDGNIYEVDPVAQTYETLGEGVWDTRFLLVVNNKLIAIEASGFWYEIDLE